MTSKSDRILVTGGCGFIGGNFIHRLIDTTSAEIANLDALTYAGNRETLAAVEDNPRYRFVHGDIADPKVVGQLIDDCLQALLEKGWTKAKNNKNKIAYSYLLMPKGIDQKAQLTVAFLKRKEAEFEALKHEIRQLSEDVTKSG